MSLKTVLWTLFVILMWACASANFDVRRHLSSRTPYEYARPVPGSIPVTALPLPEGRKAVYLYFVSRHGTRWPTKKRQSQFLSLTKLFELANATDDKPWLEDWVSPFSESWSEAGFLHSIGEVEMQNMGKRFGEYLPELFESGYRNFETAFISTQVPRASSSAVAFAQGLFPCGSDSNCRKGGNSCAKVADAGCCRPQPVAVSMLPKHEDPLLRFFNVCPSLEEYLDELKPRLAAWQLDAQESLVDGVATRLGTPAGAVTAEHVDALWQLCQQEAALLGVTDRVCSLFSQEEAELLEYVEDVKLFERRSHASCSTYSAAALLVADLVERLQKAAEAEDMFDGVEKSRFHFAHAETIAPLAALLGLHGSPGVCTVSAQSACGEAWEASLPPPPNPRAWYARTAIPFGSNIALLLHASGNGRGHQVRMLVNEQVVPMPLCGGRLDCPLLEFLESYSSDLDHLFQEACHREVN